MLDLSRGNAFNRSGRYEQAVSDFQKYLSLVPNAFNAAAVQTAIEFCTKQRTSGKTAP